MLRTVWAAAAVLALGSCGIETVSVLPAPDVDYSTQSTTALVLTHSTSRYAGTDFQGYEVYYRIYPTNISGTFTQLSTDITTLGSSPLSTLTGSLGYQAFTQAAVSNTDGTNAAETLQISGLADGDVVTLDFTDFLAAANSASEATPPVLKINGAATKNVFRSLSQATGSADQVRFSTLRTSGTLQTDTKALVSSGGSYEVDVFVAAYGMTSTIVALNSTPKAWGTIHDIVRTP